MFPPSSKLALSVIGVFVGIQIPENGIGVTIKRAK
jgi:hypothetical protein